MTTLEIAVTCVQDAVNAVAGGAESVELSFDLAAGGLTPDHAVMQAVRDVLKIPMYVILRPHAESFRYTKAQVDGMLNDIRVMQSVGVDGVVFGAVDSDNKIDVGLMCQIADASKPLPVTLHRALDGSSEPATALKALVGIVPRVLTSGPAETAWVGRDGMKLWVEQFGQQMQFVSSGSLTMAQLGDYIRWVKPHTVHLGSAAITNEMVDVEKVRQLKMIIEESGH